ncbi:hypothetical protein Bca52824_034762 [Brassica carinata]|uniref:Uncharacterized protein n=1 Tax=Brassica carinata TaxID=52824 RepID=A0A8X7UZU6_BRACI|nr:hypothetical protein Bca52824_034762 [Brassica carinata]
MDPRNPYSQNSGYVGLLNNVQNNNVQENFPYESLLSSVNIGASKIPPFSSQQSEAPSQPEDTPVTNRMGLDYSYTQPSESEDYDLRAQYAQLSDKVDSLSFQSEYDTHLREVKDLHYETEQKLVRIERIVCDLAKKRSRFANGFELVVGFMVVVLLILGVVLAARMDNQCSNKSSLTAIHWKII